MAYYTKTGNPVNNSKGVSKTIRDEFILIETAFTNLEAYAVTKSTKAGDTYTGTHDYSAATISAGVITAPTQVVADNSTKVATTAFCQALALSTGVNFPGQSGNAGKFLGTDGTSASWTVASPIPNIVVFSTPGTTTWTCPASITRARITVVGAGASCHTTSSSYSGIGAAAGATGIKTFDVIPGTIYTVTVGAAGAAVTTANTAGNSGGNSSFSGSGITTVTATGGVGRVSSDPVPASATNADISINGQVPTIQGTNTGSGVMAHGGASFYSGNALVGTAGVGFGAGSGGGGISPNSTGWAGAPGAVIIEY